MRAIWDGNRRVFPDGRVVVQPVEEETRVVNGVLTTVRVAQTVHGDCGHAVDDLGDLYQCHLGGEVVCWRCAARCQLCPRTACAGHIVGRVIEGREFVLCGACCLELETPKYIRIVQGAWRWVRGVR